jgi:O-methyltransferase/methyltransferase family protein
VVGPDVREFWGRGTISASENHERLLSIMTGYWRSQAIYAAVNVGLVDALDDQPRSPAQVARATGCDEVTIARFLRYLAGLRLVHQENDNLYVATGMAELLRDGSPFRDLVLLYGDEFYQAWGQFSSAIRTGNSAFDQAFGMDHFTYFTQTQDSARRFDRAMAASTELIADQLGQVFDFSAATCIVDIGGGNGSLLKAVLVGVPAACGVVVDQDHVVAACTRELAGHSLADRITAVPGDFFHFLPASGDVYVLSRILHDWADEDCVRLLRVCRKAMSPPARLLVIERLLPEDGGVSLASSWDMHMLAITGGRERTCQEYQRLLSEAGLRLGSVRSLPLDMSVLVTDPL